MTQDEPARDFIPITDEEAEIVKLLAQGHTAACIPAHLGRDPGSVNTTLRRLTARIEREARAEHHGARARRK